MFGGGIVIDDSVRESFNIVSESLSGGSVLSMTPSECTIFHNDAFILGAIHGGQDVYLASPRSNANLVHPKFAITVTVRTVDACEHALTSRAGTRQKTVGTAIEALLRWPLAL